MTTTLERIAAVMGCAPAEDDDLVEAVRLLKKEISATRTSALAQSNAATVLLAVQSSLRARVIDAEAEAIRWCDAVIAIGEALGLPGAGSAEIVAAVRTLAERQ